MRLSFVSQSLSTVLVLAAASVAAHPSANGAYPVPATLREVPPSLMVETLPEGTSPLVYGLGISKTLARMGVPGTLQARAPTCNTGYVATCPPTEDNCCPEAYPVCCPNPATVCCRTGSFCVGLHTCCTASQTACGEGCCDAGRTCCNGTCCDSGFTCSASGSCVASGGSSSSPSASTPSSGTTTEAGDGGSSNPPAQPTSTQGGGGGLGGNSSGIGGTSSTRSTTRSNSGTVAGSNATNSSTPEPESKNNTGAIVGGVVGGVAAVIILVGLLMFLLHKQKKNKQSKIPSDTASNYAPQPMMAQNSPYSPGFAGAGAAGVGAGAMAAGASGSPGPAQNNYYGAGGPNSGAPTPALVYNQGEQYPTNQFQQNYNNNAYGGGLDQYGRPLSAASGGAAAAPLPMWVQRASNATPASTAPSGYPDHQGYAPPPGAPQQPYYGGGGPHGNY